MSESLRPSLTDVGATITPLEREAFATVSGSVTAYWHYVDGNGVEVGGQKTGSIGTGGITLVALSSPPADAVGAVITNLSGFVYNAPTGSADGSTIARVPDIHDIPLDPSLVPYKAGRA